MNTPTRFVWRYNGKNVYLTGTFNRWNLAPMKKIGHSWEAQLSLPCGTHQYKFIVDGQWCYDLEQEHVDDGSGNINNIICVGSTLTRTSTGVVPVSLPRDSIPRETIPRGKEWGYGQNFDYFVVLDFEATCDVNNPPLPQEIIEFPSVLVDARTLKLIDEFDSFVKPIHHPTLSPFCTKLTSITQTQVDSSPTFLEVFQAHQKWLEGHGLPVDDDALGPTWTFVTCGDWDLSTMLPGQFAAVNYVDYVPCCYTRWVNIKKIFEDATGGRALGMKSMLEKLKIPLTGHHHLGIHDSRNISKIVIELCKKGQNLKTTAQLALSRYPTLTLRVRKLNERENRLLVLKKRSLGTFLGECAGMWKGKITRAFREDNGMELLLDDHFRTIKQNMVVVVSSGEDFIEFK